MHTVDGVQVKCGLVFAVLLNRLSANTMPETWKPKAWRGRTTSVKVTAKGPVMTSPGELMRAITDELGAHVQMKVVNRVTSFGQGMSLKQDDKWHQVHSLVLILCSCLSCILMFECLTCTSKENRLWSEGCCLLLG